MSASRSEEVFGYVSKPLKERMKRIKAQDPDYSESRLIRKGLELLLPKIEEELFGVPNQGKSARRHYPMVGA
jgi:hypothetical protein